MAAFASYMGAWIEINRFALRAKPLSSHPIWVRGLKYVTLEDREKWDGSHPIWVRGLKFD